MYRIASHLDTKGGFVWHPEKAPEGPLSLVLSLHDKRLYVQRNGIRIGECEVEVDGEAAGVKGTFAFVLLDLVSGQPNPFAPGEPAPLWQEVGGADGVMLPEGFADHVGVPTAFATEVQKLLVPGVVAVVTSESSTDETRTGPGFVIMSPEDGEESPPPPEPAGK
jgi:hypothetical protein